MFDIDALTTSLSFIDLIPTETDELFKEGQVKDTQQEFMVFRIPTVDPLGFCQTNQVDKKEADDEHDDGNDEESSDSNKTDLEMPHLEEDIYDGEATSDIRGSPEVNDTNLDTEIHEEPSYATRTQKNRPSSLVIGDVSSPMLTRRMCQSAGLKDLQYGLLACFLSQNEPKKVHEAMKESS